MKQVHFDSRTSSEGVKEQVLQEGKGTHWLLTASQQKIQQAWNGVHL